MKIKNRKTDSRRVVGLNIVNRFLEFQFDTELAGLYPYRDAECLDEAKAGVGWPELHLQHVKLHSVKGVACLGLFFFFFVFPLMAQVLGASNWRLQHTQLQQQEKVWSICGSSDLQVWSASCSHFSWHICLVNERQVVPFKKKSSKQQSPGSPPAGDRPHTRWRMK